MPGPLIISQQAPLSTPAMNAPQPFGFNCGMPPANCMNMTPTTDPTSPYCPGQGTVPQNQNPFPSGTEPMAPTMPNLGMVTNNANCNINLRTQPGQSYQPIGGCQPGNYSRPDPTMPYAPQQSFPQLTPPPTCDHWRSVLSVSPYRSSVGSTNLPMNEILSIPAYRACSKTPHEKRLSNPAPMLTHANTGNRQFWRTMQPPAPRFGSNRGVAVDRRFTASDSNPIAQPFLPRDVTIITSTGLRSRNALPIRNVANPSVIGTALSNPNFSTNISRPPVSPMVGRIGPKVVSTRVR